MTLRSLPPPDLRSTGDPMFNRLWTLLGPPCINVAGPSTAAEYHWACKSSGALRAIQPAV
jgi:hypothetical protein